MLALIGQMCDMGWPRQGRVLFRHLRQYLTDSDLVRAAREKNSEAWTALSRRYFPAVWRYAYALLQDVHAAEDVVAETMLAFLKGIDQIDVQSPRISAWLRSVVRHKVADHHRRSHRINNHLGRLAVENGQSCRESGPSRSLEIKESRNRVLQILDRLPDQQRIALEWKYIDGLRIREIADRLKETEKAIEAMLYRARREFRRQYEAAESASV